jgi:hypothetical protein
MIRKSAGKEEWILLLQICLGLLHKIIADEYRTSTSPHRNIFTHLGLVVQCNVITEEVLERECPSKKNSMPFPFQRRNGKSE